MTPPDPILALLDRWVAISREFDDAHARVANLDDADLLESEDQLEELANARTAVLTDLYTTRPTTFAGLVELVSAFEAEDGPAIAELGLVGTGVQTILDCVRSLASQDVNQNVLLAKSDPTSISPADQYY